MIMIRVKKRLKPIYNKKELSKWLIISFGWLITKILYSLYTQICFFNSADSNNSNQLWMQNGIVYI